jgi:hypothetical protein
MVINQEQRGPCKTERFSAEETQPDFRSFDKIPISFPLKVRLGEIDILQVDRRPEVE